MKAIVLMFSKKAGRTDIDECLCLNIEKANVTILLKATLILSTARALTGIYSTVRPGESSMKWRTTIASSAFTHSTKTDLPWLSIYVRLKTI